MLFVFGIMTGIFIGIIGTSVVLLPRIPYQEWPPKKKEPNSP